jgi:hypothetical protein
MSTVNCAAIGPVAAHVATSGTRQHVCCGYWNCSVAGPPSHVIVNVTRLPGVAVVLDAPRLSRYIGGVPVGVNVGITDGVAVCVKVALTVGVRVAVLEGVEEGVAEGGSGVGVGVDVTPSRIATRVLSTSSSAHGSHGSTGLHAASSAQIPRAQMRFTFAPPV